MMNNTSLTTEHPDIVNISSPSPSTGLGGQSVAVPTLYITVMAIGVMCNGVVTLAFIMNRDMRTISNAFVVTLSVANTNVILLGGMTTVLGLFQNLASIHSELRNSVWCPITSNLYSISVQASFISMLLITFHRYFRIARSNEWYLWVFGERWKVVVWCAGPWLLALTVSLHVQTVYVVPSFGCHAVVWHQTASLILFVVVYLIHVSTFSHTIQRLRGLQKKAQIYSSAKVKEALIERSKMLTTSLFFSSFNIHLYIPYLLLLLLIQLKDPLPLSSSLATCFVLSKLLLLLCCSSNSIVYGALNATFRNYLRKLVICDVCMNKTVDQDTAESESDTEMYVSIKSLNLFPRKKENKKAVVKKTLILHHPKEQEEGEDPLFDPTLQSIHFTGGPDDLSEIVGDSLVNCSLSADGHGHNKLKDLLDQPSCSTFLTSDMPTLKDSADNVFRFNSEFFDDNFDAQDISPNTLQPHISPISEARSATECSVEETTNLLLGGLMTSISRASVSKLLGQGTDIEGIGSRSPVLQKTIVEEPKEVVEDMTGPSQPPPDALTPLPRADNKPSEENWEVYSGPTVDPHKGKKKAPSSFLAVKWMMMSPSPEADDSQYENMLMGSMLQQSSRLCKRTLPAHRSLADGKAQDPASFRYLVKKLSASRSAPSQISGEPVKDADDQEASPAWK
ncbi:hypothetical protein ACOMHN_040705 [Nucella lapillus]